MLREHMLLPLYRYVSCRSDHKPGRLQGNRPAFNGMVDVPAIVQNRENKCRTRRQHPEHFVQDRGSFVGEMNGVYG